MITEDKMYKYETHLHTSPVSRCARSTPIENLEFYKSLGYDGIFVTNHFKAQKDIYEQDIDFHFSDYEKTLSLSKKIGIKVFFGTEISYGGSDFLVYGLDKEWFINHPEFLAKNFREQLEFFTANGALVVHAHPFREAHYIDHIRLFPRSVHGVEVFNACRTEFENKLAEQYAENYGLLKFAGSDNHVASKRTLLAGMCSETPITDEKDFVRRVLNGEMQIFKLEN